MKNVEKFKSNKIEIKELKDIFPSYPKTGYLCFSQKESISTSNDDIFFNWKEVFKDINGEIISLLVQEKMDGANAGMMFDQEKIGSKDGIIYVRNRDHILRKNYITNKESAAKMQFLPFFNEAHSKQKMLAKLNKQFGQVVAVYGEWLYAVHSTIYDNLPGQFMAFDIWLTKDKKFIDPIVAKTALIDMEFEIPHTLFEEKLSPIQLESIIKEINSSVENLGWKSFYGNTDKSEGIYVKIGNQSSNTLLSRFKIVRNDYKSNFYWNEKVVTKQKLKGH